MAVPCEERTPEISVVVPVFNEAGGVTDVLSELADVLDAGLTRPCEVIVVDDGSTDGTSEAVRALAVRRPGVFRLLRHDRNAGQSFAFHTGFHAARGAVVVTMDGDGQNLPSDIPRVVNRLGADCDCCCGYRGRRMDTVWRRLGSVLANGVRNAVLHETIRDTGCSMKAFKREFLIGLQPWNGMHRFFASMVMLQGGRVQQIEVGHRPRIVGQSKYTNWSRLKRTVFDLFAVKWLKRRSRVYGVAEDPLSSRR